MHFPVNRRLDHLNWCRSWDSFVPQAGLGENLPKWLRRTATTDSAARSDLLDGTMPCLAGSRPDRTRHLVRFQRRGGASQSRLRQRRPSHQQWTGRGLPFLASGSGDWDAEPNGAA